MNTIIGDILDVKEGIICHQVNCRRVAGAGLALAIRNKYPQWFNDYAKTTPSLGKVTLFEVNKNLHVANFFAQNDYGRGVTVFTNYSAFEQCLSQLYTEWQTKYSNLSVYFPYLIGCGLAGGDWKVILPMIEKYFPTQTVVKLPNL